MKQLKIHKAFLEGAMINTDILVVGAGPAGLATAIRLKQNNKGLSVLVIDKAHDPGAHALSGAVFESSCLDELVTGWRADKASFFSEMTPVTKDEMFFLLSGSAVPIPAMLVPPGMHHKGDDLISLSRLVVWLGGVAAREGVDVYHGVAAASLLWEGGTIKGVKLVDQGLDKDRKPMTNFQEGEEVRARVTVLADGGRGVLSQEYVRKAGGNKNPQVYSIGVKQVFRMPADNFQSGRTIHTLGFPLPLDVFGGGFLYSMGKDIVAVGLILGLDWRYTDLDPQKELEIYKSHPFIAGILKGGTLLEAGAKIIPEGGFFAMPGLSSPGVILVGDSAGLVNMEKIKGVHYAILSGMAAADAILSEDLSSYKGNLEARGVLRGMRHASNFRAVFQAGLFVGAPLSMIQHLWPWRIKMGEDHAHTVRGVRLARTFKPVLERAGFAALSGTMHREDEPSHLIITDTAVCARCEKKFNSPCTTFCPVEVYSSTGDGLHISAANCVHCGTCAIKCPFQNIVWTPPEGGEGPRHTLM
jgi:electron-transferring-flavoprotein dehydrogenase